MSGPSPKSLAANFVAHHGAAVAVAASSDLVVAVADIAAEPVDFGKFAAALVVVAAAAEYCNLAAVQVRYNPSQDVAVQDGYVGTEIERDAHIACQLVEESDPLLDLLATFDSVDIHMGNSLELQVCFVFAFAHLEAVEVMDDLAIDLQDVTLTV